MALETGPGPAARDTAEAHPAAAPGGSPAAVEGTAGGARDDRPDEMFARWQRALALPGVRGLVVGRNLLYPADGDVVAAVKTAVSLL